MQDFDNRIGLLCVLCVLCGESRAVAGGAAGYVTAKLLPGSPTLLEKTAVGGLVGAAVAGGLKVVTNVAQGPPWHEGLGTALAVGFTTGAMDAAMDYYGDKLVETQLGRPPRGGGATGDETPLRQAGDAEDLRLRSHEPSELRRAIDVLYNRNAPPDLRYRAQDLLLDSGLQGIWMGGESVAQFRAQGVEVDELAVAARLEALELEPGRTHGFIDYGDVNQGGQRSGARALITPEMMAAGRGTPPRPSITPPGYEGRPGGHHKAHLIAARFGGSGDVEANLVTLFEHANTPLMRGFENDVAAVVMSGETVYLEVIPLYVASGELPVAVTMYAQGSEGLELYAVIPNVPKQ